MSKPLVSICSITFNHSTHIRQCLEGFMMQQCNFDFEVLIHDDASTDGTQEIIKEYQEKYPDIIKPILQTENQYSKGIPISSTFNFPRAQGKYIALCEGDDYWTDPLKLQKQVDFLEENPDCVLVGHDAKILDENGNLLSLSKLPKKSKRSANGKDLMKGFWVLTLSMVFRNIRELFDNYPQEAATVPNGDTFLISVLGNYGNFHYMPEIKPAVYRVHQGGVWSKKTQMEKLKMHIKTFIQLEKYYLKNNSAIALHFKKRKLNTIKEFLLLSYHDRDKNNFYYAYKLYFKQYRAYKNYREFVYLHKILIKFILNKV